MIKLELNLMMLINLSIEFVDWNNESLANWSPKMGDEQTALEQLEKGNLNEILLIHSNRLTTETWMI